MMMTIIYFSSLQLITKIAKSFHLSSPCSHTSNFLTNIDTVRATPQVTTRVIYNYSGTISFN